MLVELVYPLAEVVVETVYFADDGRIPNHPTLPMIIYKNVLRLVETDPASIAEQLFAHNGWQGTWRNGIFDFPHYHSNAHEVLAICRGAASVRFGGNAGDSFLVAEGDVALLPAGTGHQRLSPSGNLLVVGAYPPGQLPNLHRVDRNDSKDERQKALSLIARVPLPMRDPIYGEAGPLSEFWTK